MTVTNPSPRHGRGAPAWWRSSAAIGVLLLGALFAAALLSPLPTAPNTARAEVVARVEDRLPGWSVVRADSSWEGAWTVVVLCGERHVGFQLVPGHGLPPGDAWLQPQDGYSRARLRSISDDTSYLIWYDHEDVRTLSCRSELARRGLAPGRNFD